MTALFCCWSSFQLCWMVTVFALVSHFFALWLASKNYVEKLPAKETISKSLHLKIWIVNSATGKHCSVAFIWMVTLYDLILRFKRIPILHSKRNSTAGEFCLVPQLSFKWSHLWSLATKANGRSTTAKKKKKNSTVHRIIHVNLSSFDLTDVPCHLHVDYFKSRTRKWKGHCPYSRFHKELVLPPNCPLLIKVTILSSFAVFICWNSLFLDFQQEVIWTQTATYPCEEYFPAFLESKTVKGSLPGSWKWVTTGFYLFIARSNKN